MDTQDRDKLNTMGELSSILAHEIKNPLNSIMINLAVLRSTIEQIPAASKYVSVIEDEVKRLDKVISSFLDFANPSQTTQIKIKINNVISSALEFMQHEFELKNVEVETRLTEPSPTLVGSADQIKQAFLNLAINALQAMPLGGKIKITTRFKDAQTISVEVEDSGLGIPNDIQAKIFDPYFTTKEKGSGLGLTVVRQIVKSHGGEVTVKSVPGVSTCFYLDFPCSLPPPGTSDKG